MTVTDQIVDWFAEATQDCDANLEFNIVEFNDEPYFPQKADGFTYTEETYAACRDNTENCHFPDDVSWTKICSDFDVCTRFNNNEFDELWVWGGGYFGYFENNLAGEDAFIIQDDYPLENTGCIDLMPVVGLNWEEGLPNSIHSFGHRAKGAIMYSQGINQAIWGVSQNDISNPFNRYTHLDFQSTYDFSGCGNIHTPPNSSTSYEYDSSSSVQTMCDDFIDYPALEDPVTTLRTISNCAEWGCTDLGYYRWWFQHLPHNEGLDANGKYNNWWQYFANPHYVILNDLPTPTVTEPVTTTPTITDTPLVTATPLVTTTATNNSETQRPVQSTIPNTAFVDDKTDRIIIGALLIVVGIYFNKFKLKIEFN